MTEFARLELDGRTYELPILVGTEGERAIDISKLRAQTGYITLDDGYVNTGTGLDGSTVNTRPIPLDAQTWSSLATGDPRYGAALDWTLANLIATDGPYTGPSISEVDVSKAWFEGGGHLALALKLRDGAGDADGAEALLRSIRLAQRDAPNGDGKGIVATSNDGLDSGFGDLYYASLHTGATAWYLLAAAGDSPFALPVE